MKPYPQAYPLVPQRADLWAHHEHLIVPMIQDVAQLAFFDESGAIRAGCYFGERDWHTFDLGIVPDDIAQQGPEAVRAWAETGMHALVERERKRRESREERVNGLRREIDFHTVDGVRIRATVTKDRDGGARDDWMRITMHEPFDLVQLIHVRPSCWAEGMSGGRTFDDGGNLLPQEIERQDSLLLHMYEKEVRRRQRPPAHPALSGLPRSRYDEED